jgi:UDP-perosamine 4-acetyltransferase
VSSTRVDKVPRIVGVGAGGHAVSLLEAIRSSGRFRVVALSDGDPAKAGSELLEVPVVAPSALATLRADGVAYAFVGVGGVGDSSGRTRVHEELLRDGFELPAILHATAILSPWARVGPGAQILAGAIVNAGAEIEAGAIVNTGAIIEHDCRIGAHAHVGPGARIAGLASVGKGAHVGIGAIVIEGRTVGDGALVAAGAVVVKDVAEGARVAGVPARELGA